MNHLVWGVSLPSCYHGEHPSLLECSLLELTVGGWSLQPQQMLSPQLDPRWLEVCPGWSRGLEGALGDQGD